MKFISFLQKKLSRGVSSFYIRRHRRMVLSAVRGGLVLGRNVTIMDGVRFDPPHNGLIEIGDNSTIAPEVMFLAHDASMFKSIGMGRLGQIKIRENCFIGARTILLPGVDVGANSIVGSGSVVSKDVPENSVVTGNPAKVVGSFEGFLGWHRLNCHQVPVFDYVHFYEDIKSNIKNIENENISKKAMYTKGQSSNLRSRYRFNVE